MSYQCGMGAAMARAFGFTPCDPHIRCDGCGKTAPVTPANRPGLPYRWFTAGKAKPGWTGGSNDDHTRWDRCPDCRVDGET